MTIILIEFCVLTPPFQVSCSSYSGEKLNKALAVNEGE